MATVTAPSTPEPTAAELIAGRPHLSMHAMDGLVMDGVPLNLIADRVGTPVWVLFRELSPCAGAYRMLADALSQAGSWTRTSTMR